MAAFAAFDFLVIYPPFPGAQLNIAMVEALVAGPAYDLFCYGNGVTSRLPATPEAVAEALYVKLGAPVATTFSFGDRVRSTGTEIPTQLPIGHAFSGIIVAIFGVQFVVAGVLQAAINLIQVQLTDGFVYTVQESALVEITGP